MNRPSFGPAERRNAETLIELAFAEDLGTAMPDLRLDVQTGRIELSFEAEHPTVGDLTGSTTIPANARGAARFVVRSPGMVAGLPVLEMIARRFGLSTWYQAESADGDQVRPGTAIASIAGEMRALLMLERTALNFLQRLSGIASMTARFVAEVAGTKTVILDTRKTTPGWRALEKYAVRCGGGTNHRFGLYDAVLIKDNHLAWLGPDHDPIGTAVRLAKGQAPPSSKFIEVEVDSLEQFDRALQCEPDIILIDNLGPEALAEAVRRRDARALAWPNDPGQGMLLEASGGITLATVRGLAESGVDRISVGALTHSAPALDIGLDFDRVIDP